MYEETCLSVEGFDECIVRCILYLGAELLLTTTATMTEVNHYQWRSVSCLGMMDEKKIRDRHVRVLVCLEASEAFVIDRWGPCGGPSVLVGDLTRPRSGIFTVE